MKKIWHSLLCFILKYFSNSALGEVRLVCFVSNLISNPSQLIQISNNLIVHIEDSKWDPKKKIVSCWIMQKEQPINIAPECNTWWPNISSTWSISTNCLWATLHKKCPSPELFWSAYFSHFPAFRLNTERYVVMQFGSSSNKCLFPLSSSWDVFLRNKAYGYVQKNQKQLRIF